MNINTIDQDIEKIKEYSPELFNEIIHLTVPFYMFHQKMTTAIERMLEEKHQISNSELDVMSCLKMTKGRDYTLSPTKIYERLFFTTGGITKVLKKLEEKKFIIRMDNQYDKRSKLVQLTPLGIDKFSKALTDVLAYEEKCFSSLSQDEKTSFKNHFRKMLKDF